MSKWYISHIEWTYSHSILVYTAGNTKQAARTIKRLNKWILKAKEHQLTLLFSNREKVYSICVTSLYGTQRISVQASSEGVWTAKQTLCSPLRRGDQIQSSCVHLRTKCTNPTICAVMSDLQQSSALESYNMGRGALSMCRGQGTLPQAASSLDEWGFKSDMHPATAVFRKTITLCSCHFSFHVVGAVEQEMVNRKWLPLTLIAPVHGEVARSFL